MRLELEHEINRASEGELNEQEVADLKKRLEDYPDLLEGYREIMNLPDLSIAYSTIHPDNDRLDRKINQILTSIEDLEEPMAVFGEMAVYWFKRYALAASILIAAVTTGIYFNQSTQPEAEFFMEELFYPSEDEAAEPYVLYLDQFFEQ